MIRIYTTPICAYCKMAKEYFKSKELQYEEIPLVGNSDAQKLVVSKTGMVAAPIIEINGKFIVGFNRQEIDNALN
ncbi:MAG: NrdH-redoxin [Candidatus Yanofskybacteria bacterium]|nr:NrdH-redoxin [Candidatus Yanofskybacteria bacterium]